MRIIDKLFLIGTVVGAVANIKVQETAELAWFTESDQEPTYHPPPGSPPHRPPHWPSPGDRTIYATLSKHKEYTKLTKAIDFVDDIKAILNDCSIAVTFLAVPDSALRPPRRRHLDTDITNIASLMVAYDLSDAVHLVDQLEAQSGDAKDHQRKKSKKFLKKLIRAILSYHILPSKYSAARLMDNNTYATNLLLPHAMGTRAMRIRVSPGLLSLLPKINFYSSIVHPDGAASNGVIHGIDHALLPPPPAFQELFMIPGAFAALTSSTQRVDLTNALDLKYARGNKGERGRLEGATALTAFAPTNHAFEVLPHRLRLYLFSPFGAHALKKLLQYHVVPDFVFHTDYQFNKTESLAPTITRAFDLSKLGHLGSDGYPLRHEPLRAFDMGDEERKAISPSFKHHTFPITARDFSRCGEWQPGELIDSFATTLPTLLADHTLHVHVQRFNVTLPLPIPHKPHRIQTRLTVNGRLVLLPDIASLNGAIHVTGHLIDPRGHDHRDCAKDPWEDWEDWLPQWAAKK